MVKWFSGLENKIKISIGNMYPNETNFTKKIILYLETIRTVVGVGLLLTSLLQS
jgi:hypothetical protein